MTEGLSSTQGNVSPQLVFWLNAPSPHQEDLLREVSERTSGDLLVVYSGPMRSMRKAQGWSVNPTGYDLIFLPPRIGAFKAAMLAWRFRHSFSIIGGVWSTLPNLMACLILFILRSRYAIYSEAPSRVFADRLYSLKAHRIRVVPRSIVERLASRTLVSRARGIFAISSLAADWFESLGVPKEKIYLFGYFRTFRDDEGTAPLELESEPLDLVYVGTDDYRKGVDLLLDALEPLWSEYPALRLIVAGAASGDSSPFRYLENDAEKRRIKYLGAVESNIVHTVMRDAFMVVVPSRYDGWGMAISESIMSGTPVLASDRCGGSDLIEPRVSGLLFPAGDVEELRNALRCCLPDHREELRLGSKAFGFDGDSPTASTLIQGIGVKSNASYFLDCVEHMNSGDMLPMPTPPWLRSRARVVPDQ